MQLSFQLLPEQPASELLGAVELADRLGYHACYSADEIYHKDAWLLLAAAAERTERIRLGPCVAPIYMREPTYVAQLAATLDELSAGRAEVGVGGDRGRRAARLGRAGATHGGAGPAPGQLALTYPPGRKLTSCSRSLEPIAPIDRTGPTPRA